MFQDGDERIHEEWTFALRDMVELSLDGFFIIQETKMIYVNQAFATISGYHKESLIGMDFRDLVAPEDRERVAHNYFARQAGENIPSQYEFLLLHRDGETRIPVWLHAAVFEFQGKIASYGYIRDIGLYRRMLEALKASEGFIAETITDIVLTVNEEGVILYINRAAERILGWRPEEIIGRPVTTIIPEAFVDAHLRAFKKYIQTGKKTLDWSQLAFTARRKDGSEVPTEITLNTGEYEGRRFFVAVMRDITKRKEILEHIRLLSSVVAQVELSVAITDCTGKILYVNPAFENEFQCHAQDMMGQPFAIFDERRTPSNLILDARRRLEAGETIYIDIPMMRTSGTSFMADVSIHPLRGDKGNSCYLVFFIRDITEKIQMDQRLRLSEQRYRLLFERNLAGVYQSNLEGELLDANDAMVRMFGFPDRESLIQHRAQELYLNPVERVQWINKLREKKSLTNYEVCYRRSDGTPFWVLESATLIDSQPPGLIEGILIDITERKRAEEIQKHLNRIMESAGDYVFIADAREEIQYFNTEGAKVLGWDAPFSPGSACLSDVFPESAYLQVQNEVLPAATQDGVWKGKLIMNRKDKSTIPVEVLAMAPMGKEDQDRVYTFIARDLTSQQQITVQMEQLRSEDLLTGLFNRRYFQEVLSARLQEIDRGAYWVLDIDRFRSINDILGPQVGDEVLAQFGKFLRSYCGDEVLIARMGGDDFALFFPGDNTEENLRKARALLAEIQKHTLHVQHHRLQITVNIGVVFYPEHGKNPHELQTQADIALLQARQSGYNSVQMLDPQRPYPPELQRRLDLEQQIRRAVEAQSFVLYAQPILDLRTRKFTHFELLIRMKAHGGRIIPAAEFLNLAENLGHSHYIDRWVVSEVTRWMQESFGKDGFWKLNINLSGKTMADPEFLDFLKDKVRQGKVDPERIVLEITETAAIRDLQTARDFITKMKQEGYHFALDDFGAGFSSFSYLKYLPIDYLKIDGSFITHILDNREDRAIVRAITNMAHALHLKTIAEYVSHPDILPLLSGIGVDFAQGFSVAPPQPFSSELLEFYGNE